MFAIQSKHGYFAGWELKPPGWPRGTQPNWVPQLEGAKLYTSEGSARRACMGLASFYRSFGAEEHLVFPQLLTVELRVSAIEETEHSTRATWAAHEQGQPCCVPER